MNMTLTQQLFESKIRHQNCLDAIRLGIFGQSHEEITKNLSQYNISQKQKIDTVCNVIESELKHA